MNEMLCDVSFPPKFAKEYQSDYRGFAVEDIVMGFSAV